jgi:methyl-accepting chemotaxis protein
MASGKRKGLTMNLTDLSQYARQYDPDLPLRIKDFLEHPEIRSTKGARRVEMVCENFKFLSFEQAYHMLDPDAFQDEFEDVQLYKRLITGLNFGRILLSLAPLILTWLALFLATDGYQKDIAKYADDRTKPFLQLWQAGFHNTLTLTFSATALGDVLLLLSLLLSSLGILFLEYQARKTSRQFADELRSVTEGLLKAVTTEGVSPVTSQADIDKIVKAIRVALGGVFTTTEETIKKALDVVLKANDRVDQLFANQVQPMFTKFDQNVSTFHLDVSKLTQEVSVLSAASTTVATASTSMSSAASSMATSAANLPASVKQIDATLVTLDQTQKDMVIKIEAAQQKVADEVSKTANAMDGSARTVAGAASNMTRAAQTVENVGKTLSAINPKTVQQITNEVTILTDKAKETSKELQTVINELKTLNKQSNGKTTKTLFNRVSSLFK